uniref:Secreted protein n=1 Tax=Cacopsylla melanoneura TaxID=428564 RepID=A0A8D8QKC6_9HEMI
MPAIKCIWALITPVFSRSLVTDAPRGIYGNKFRTLTMKERCSLYISCFTRTRELSEKKPLDSSVTRVWRVGSFGALLSNRNCSSRVFHRVKFRPFCLEEDCSLGVVVQSSNTKVVSSWKSWRTFQR